MQPLLRRNQLLEAHADVSDSALKSSLGIFVGNELVQEYGARRKSQASVDSPDDILAADLTSEPLDDEYVTGVQGRWIFWSCHVNGVSCVINKRRFIDDCKVAVYSSRNTASRFASHLTLNQFREASLALHSVLARY